MWSFDWYWEEYLRLCSEQGLIARERNWIRAEIGTGGEPKDAFVFFHHELAQPVGASVEGVRLVAPGYDRLAVVLAQAFEQAATGKGAERHADSKPFHDQPMQLIADKRGIGFILGQADKKSEEAQGMLNRGQKEACVKELLGAIVYLAGAIIFVEKNL